MKKLRKQITLDIKENKVRNYHIVILGIIIILGLVIDVIVK